MTDNVTPELADFVLKRDKGCVAALRFGEEGCRDIWGEPVRPWLVAHPSRRWRIIFQLDHVKDATVIGEPIPKRDGDRKHRYRAPSDADHLWCLCAYHHEFWARATSNRVKARLYLKEVASATRLPD